MEVTWELQGMEQLNRNLEKVIKSLSPEEIEPILLASAKQVADDARSNAPLGPTGNLKRGIVAKTLRRIGNEPAPSIAAIDFRIAPHAHLIEFGTVERHQKSGKSTGVSPAHPFFRPAWDKNRGHIEEDIRAKVKAQIEGAV